MRPPFIDVFSAEDRTQMTTRRRFPGKFRVVVALETRRGDKTAQEIAARHNVHPTQVTAWKRRATHILCSDTTDNPVRRRVRYLVATMPRPSISRARVSTHSTVFGTPRPAHSIAARMFGGCLRYPPASASIRAANPLDQPRSKHPQRRTHGQRYRPTTGHQPGQNRRRHQTQRQ